MKFSAVDMAFDILNMQDELIYLRREVERLKVYEKDYHELLSASIKHGEQMMVNLLDLVMTPGVVEACVKNRENEK